VTDHCSAGKYHSADQLRRRAFNTVGADRRRQPRRPKNCVVATAVAGHGGGGGDGDGNDGNTVQQFLCSSSILSSSVEMSACLI
jgi:hypothetical protein